MTYISRLTQSFLPLLILTACMERQTPPDLTAVPQSSFKIETIAENLNTPWAVATLPNGEYLFTEKAGHLKKINTDGVIQNISGLPTDIYTEEQAGLFDVIISRDFVNTKMIYISYARGTDDKNGTTLISAVLKGDTLTEVSTLFTANPDKNTSAHFGGRVIELPSGQLMLGLGDGFTYREAAQDQTSHLGKIVIINPKELSDTKIYSSGHRNVQGLHFDNITGDVWAHEHGPRGGDELNLIKQGSNYGWPLATTGTDYNGAKITPKISLDGAIPFVHQWTPSIAPSGLSIYRGDLFKDWNGDALIGGLASKNLRRVDLENQQSIGEEIILPNLNARIRDVRTDADGTILIVINRKDDNDKNGGAILRLSPKN